MYLDHWILMLLAHIITLFSYFYVIYKKRVQNNTSADTSEWVNYRNIKNQNVRASSAGLEQDKTRFMAAEVTYRTLYAGQILIGW